MQHLSKPVGEFPLKQRLAETLTRSATAPVPIRFIVDAGEPLDGELGGTVYLVTAVGIDQWELYLSLRLAGAEWTVWTANGAVRMLRHPRGGEPQIYLVE